MKKWLINLTSVLKVIALFVLLFLAITVISSVSFTIAEKLYGVFRGIDPDNSFLLITIHHILQAIIALFLILIISKITKLKLTDFGFNKNDFKYSVKAVLIFCGIWAVIQAAGSIYMIKTTNMSAAFAFPLTFKNFLGYFLFEILLTGTSEEILFRSLAIPPMLLLLGKFIKPERKSNIIAVAAATLIFMLAHINFNLNPFRITHVYLPQQITCLIFGVFFGYLFTKTKSVIGPVLAHNALNGVITIVSLIMYFVFG